MKPPTVFELRDIAANHRGGANFHRHQLKHSNLSEDEKATERRLERQNTIIALACERWQFALEASCEKERSAAIAASRSNDRHQPQPPETGVAGKEAQENL